MPTATHHQESPEPPPAPGGATLASECFPEERFFQEKSPSEEPASTQVASEAELLGLMSGEGTDSRAAREAWAELHNRHARYLFTVVARAFGAELGSRERIFDVVADTLQTAFDWAGKQPSAEQLTSRFDDPEPDGTRRRVLGWLSVIARRIAADRVASDVDSPVELLGDVAAPEPDEEPPPVLRSLLKDALGKLSWRETEALRASLPWYEPETGEFSFPRGEAANVAASLGISPDTLRQRRHRSLKRIKSLLQSGEGEGGR